MSGLNWIYQWYHMITVYRCAATGTDTDCRFLRRKKAGQIRLPRWKLSRTRVSDSLCFACAGHELFEDFYLLKTGKPRRKASVECV